MMKENLRKNRLFFWGLLCGILGYALVDFLSRPFLLRVQLASENAKVFYTLGSALCATSRIKSIDEF